MYDMRPEFPHDSSQAPQEKLKSRACSAGHVYLLFETLGLHKIFIEASKGTDALFKAFPREALNYFNNSEFCASDTQAINHMQHPETGFDRLFVGPTDGLAKRTNLRGLGRGVGLQRNHFVFHRVTLGSSFTQFLS